MTEPMKTPQLVLPRVLTLTTAILVTIALVMAVFPSLHIRFWADDFCYAEAGLREGFWGAQRYWYETWSGRFAYTFVAAIAGVFGVRGVPFLAFIVVASWIFGFTWLISETGKYHAIRLRWMSAFVLGELIVFLTLFSAPDIAQILYWQTGMLTYLVPLVLATITTALLVFFARTGRDSAPAILAVFLLSVVACGFSETTSVFFLTGSIVASVWLLVKGRSPLRSSMLRLCAASLAGCLIGTSIVALAPGNSIRQDYFSQPDNLLQWLDLTVKYSVVFCTRSIVRNFAAFAFAVLVASLTAFDTSTGQSANGNRRPLLIWLLVIPAGTFLLVMSTIAPAIYATLHLPPDRAQLVSQFILVCSSVLWGFVVGLFVRSRVNWERLVPVPRFVSTNTFAALVRSSVVIVALALLVFLASTSIRQQTKASINASAYSYGWDKRDLVIREQLAAGIINVIIAPLKPFPGIGEGAEPAADASRWVNNCIADYYGAESVIVDFTLRDYSDVPAISD